MPDLNDPGLDVGLGHAPSTLLKVKREAKRGTYFDVAHFVTFLFLPHFEAICDLLLNSRTAMWNLFVNAVRQF